MVLVDFSNPYLRFYLSNGYCDAHERIMNQIREALPSWVEKARREETRGRPLAITLDIDEVILSNIHMNSFRGAQGPEVVDFWAADYFSGPDGKPWPRDSRLNPLLPGAAPLLMTARGLDLTPFLITGRLESIRDETVENFVAVGLASDQQGSPAVFRAEDLARPGGPLLMCPDDQYPPPGSSVRFFKESRRKQIEEKYRIVANIGDQVSDLGLYGDVQVRIPHPFYWID